MTRVGHKQLVDLLGRCDGRRRQIIEAVGELRLLTGEQIRRLHFNAGATESADRRHARRELSWLADNRLLHRLERRVGGTRGGSESTVYSLGPIGCRAVEFWNGNGLTRPSPQWEPGAPFVSHTLGIAELYVELTERQHHGDIELLRWESEPNCWRSYVGPYGDKRQLRPDAFAVVADASFEYSWFIEFDRGTERVGTLRRKLRGYSDFAASPAAHSRDGVLPHVLWITPTLERASKLTALASDT